jgi:hypothetical protein
VIDVAALVRQIGPDAQRKHPVDHGEIQNAVFVVAEPAVMRVGEVGADFGAERVEVRLPGDEPDGAAHGTRAVQCALRSTQDLDTVEVKELGLHRAVELLVLGRHRHFVDVDADRGGPRRGTDAADLDVVETRTRARLERDARHGTRDVIVVGDMVLRELRPADCRDADRNVLDVLGTLLRGHDDLLQLRAFLLGGRRHDDRRRHNEREQSPQRRARRRTMFSDHPIPLKKSPARGRAFHCIVRKASVLRDRLTLYRHKRCTHVGQLLLQVIDLGNLLFE